jgi:hypothetical protein
VRISGAAAQVIGVRKAGDVGDLLEALLGWVRRHPELVEGRL